MIFFSMNLKNSNKGIALLITVSVVTVLIVTTLELNRRMRSSLTISASGRDQITLMGMASSGIHGAMALLVSDKQDTPIDSVNEDWADPAIINRIVDSMDFRDGHLRVEISDELSRIQVNALVDGPDGQNFNILQQQLLFRFLNLFIPFENRDNHTSPDAIIDSIKDWIDYGDADAITGLNGAESEYYRGLDPPYSCSDNFLTDETELMRIKGITRNLYEGSPETPGLSRYLTVFGVFKESGKEMIFPGKININTAEASVLAALLPTGHEDLANRLIDYRKGKPGDTFTHDLSDPYWYTRVPGFESIRIDPELLTTSSDIFRIRSTAQIGENQLTIMAVVYRQKEPETGKLWCKVLSWKIK